MVEHSAVNYTAEHHKPLFWRRLATKLAPLLVPQLCPAHPEQMVGIGSTPVNSSTSHSVDRHFSGLPTIRPVTSIPSSQCGAEECRRESLLGELSANPPESVPCNRTVAPTLYWSQ
jgi:hypothetical protein